jgi:hypothetical protein
MFRRLIQWRLKIACEGSECLVYYEFRIKYFYSYLYKNMVNCMASLTFWRRNFFLILAHLYIKCE